MIEIPQYAIDIPPHEFQRLDLKARLLGSYIYFAATFYEIINERSFNISMPIGRPSHHLLISRELTDVFYGRTSKLLINIPPRLSKSTMCVYFIAWAMAHYPDSNFIYVSYGHDLASGHTATIQQIIKHPLYKKLFGVSIDAKFSAKDNFKTNFGGSVRAFGSSGPITGQNAGLPGINRFGGLIVIDDSHKPDDVHSDTLREKVIENYKATIKTRLMLGVPIFFIGQRLHESDLPSFLIEGKDGYDWRKIILQNLDDNLNPIDPTVYSREMLIIERDFNEYVFAAQHQQNPIPAGGSLFKESGWVIVDEEPEILATFITIDAAETDKTYNDATVFTFFGLHKIKTGAIDTGLYGLHVIDCVEMRINIEDLEAEFLDFYASCMRHKVKPERVAIEKASAGTTLLALLKKYQGMEVVNINRTKASGSKTTRYLEMVKYIATGCFSFMRRAKHTEMCIKHMSKITANNTHSHDDIADTFYDACKIALIDKTLIYQIVDNETNKLASQKMSAQVNALNRARGMNAYQ